MITATNEDLSKAVQSGKFREDLYFRINEFLVEIPPLRKRRGDITVFAKHFLNLANRSLNKETKGFSREALEKLKNYYWHGNLRELFNVVKRAVLFCGGHEISARCLPDEIVNPQYFNDRVMESQQNAESTNLKSIVERAEKDLIVETLKKTGNNKSKTAKLLNIDRRTLYNKLSDYHIES